MLRRHRTLALAAIAGLVTGGLIATQARANPPLIMEWELPRCATGTTELARQIQDCMERVMHPRGLEGGPEPEVDMSSAALLCRHTRGPEHARAAQTCVRSLMYERSGLGARRAAVNGEAAALACRHASSLTHAEVVEGCMRRLLYTREGLGTERTSMSATAAAYACQSTVAPVPQTYVLYAYPGQPLQPVCSPPRGEEAVRFMEECVRRLSRQRDGLGEPRTDITPDVAAVACEGALAWLP